MKIKTPAGAPGALPAAPPRGVTAAERAAYAADGAAVLRAILQPAWIALMQDAVDRILADPGPAGVEYTPAGKRGRYYGDFFCWLRDPDFRALMADSPLPAVAAQLMAADTVTFFYDQLLVKEPATEEPTPWHQDLPYWPVRGADIVSLWVPFDPVPLDAGAVVYLRGSHRWGTMYAPRPFGDDTGFGELYAKMGLPEAPDIAADLDRYETLVWAVEPGDVIAHHPLTFHGSGGNRRSELRRRALALRYLGDDAVYDARPGTFVENPKVAALLPEPIAYADGARLGGANFPRVWPRQPGRIAGQSS